MSDVKSTPVSWHIIPMRDFPHLSVIRDRDGNIVATVQNEYAHLFNNLPELLATTREVFERLALAQKNWAPTSILGRLESVITRIESPKKDPTV